jgi:hypothetical protein
MNNEGVAWSQYAFETETTIKTFLLNYSGEANICIACECTRTIKYCNLYTAAMKILERELFCLCLAECRRPDEVEQTYEKGDMKQ